MILEFKIKNFLSFKDEVTFSFEATKDKNLEEYYVTEIVPGVRLLKLGIVYGANASGKSNLINAFEFIKNFCFSIPESKTDKISVSPFLFDEATPTNPSEFKLTFYAGTTKFVYTLKTDNQTVFNERLDYYPGVQPAIVFDRKFAESVSQITFGPKIKISSKAKEEVAVKCLPNKSFFAAYQQLNLNVTEIELAIEWLRTNLDSPIQMKKIDLSLAERRIAQGDNMRSELLKCLQSLGLNISSIHTQIMQNYITDDFEDKLRLMGISKTELAKVKKEPVVQTYIEHKVDTDGTTKFYTMPLEKQSDGTKQLFALYTSLIEQSHRKSLLAIDDFDLLLHPLLMEEILTNFLKEKSTNSQLLITTNNISLLNEKDLIRKDAIWFTNKKDNGSTELYSLADFNIRKELSYYNAYKVGKFGAVPKVG